MHHIILILILVSNCRSSDPCKLENELSNYKSPFLETFSANPNELNKENTVGNSKFKTFLNIQEDNSNVDADQNRIRSKRQIPGAQDTKMMIGTFQAILRPMTADGNILDTIKNSQNTTEDDDDVE